MDWSKNRAKLSNSQGRTETDQSRMMRIRHRLPSTLMSSANSSRLAAYLSVHIDVGKPNGPIKLTRPIVRQGKGDFVVDPVAKERHEL